MWEDKKGMKKENVFYKHPAASILIVVAGILLMVIFTWVCTIYHQAHSADIPIIEKPSESAPIVTDCSHE